MNDSVNRNLSNRILKTIYVLSFLSEETRLVCSTGHTGTTCSPQVHTSAVRIHVSSRVLLEPVEQLLL